MSKELKYYHKNKDIINLKRKLKYKLDSKKISLEEYIIQLDLIESVDKNIKDNEMIKLKDDLKKLQKYDISELIILKKYIEKLIKSS